MIKLWLQAFGLVLAYPIIFFAALSFIDKYHTHPQTTINLLSTWGLFAFCVWSWWALSKPTTDAMTAVAETLMRKVQS